MKKLILILALAGIVSACEVNPTQFHQNCQDRGQSDEIGCAFGVIGHRTLLGKLVVTTISRTNEKFGFTMLFAFICSGCDEKDYNPAEFLGRCNEHVECASIDC